jgi:MFS family permease
MGAMGAGLSAWILERFPFSTSFVYIFAIAAAAILVSWFFLALTREPLQPVDVPRQSNRQFLANLPAIVQGDDNFRRFLIARSLMAVGGMGVGFITVAALQRWQVADATVGVYTAVSLLAQTTGNLFFGFLADRFGHKLSLELGALASVVAFALAWLAPSAGWTYAVFCMLGISTGALLVSGTLVVMEFSHPRRRPTYLGLANTTVGLVSVAAPLLGAWLASAGYGWVFALSMAVNLAALAAMHFWVREPRRTTATNV